MTNDEMRARSQVFVVPMELPPPPEYRATLVVESKRASVVRSPLTVTECGDCPMCEGFACLAFGGHGRMLHGIGDPTPEWCPLRAGPVTVRLARAECWACVEAPSFKPCPACGAPSSDSAGLREGA